MSQAALRVEALAFEKQFAYFFMTYEQVKGDLLAKLPKYFTSLACLPRAVGSCLKLQFGPLEHDE